MKDKYSLDGAGRISGWSQSTTSGGTVNVEAYTRNSAGLLQSGATNSSASGVTWPSATTNYGYDTNDRLCQSGSATPSACGTTPPSGNTADAYDAADNLTSLPNGATGKFDAANELCYSVPSGGSTSAACSAPPSTATTFGYDAFGDRTTVTPPASSGQSQTQLGYDLEHRLTSATVPGAPGNAGQYNSVTSARILDTRSGSSNKGNCYNNGSPVTCAQIPAGGTLVVQILGQGNLPSSGVNAAALSVTALPVASGPSGGLTIWDGAGPRPTATSVSYAPGTSESNQVITKVDGSGRVSIYASQAVDVLIDSEGWYSAPSGAAGGGLSAQNATRIVDTRSGSRMGSCPTSSSQCTQITNGGTLTVQVSGRGNVPTSGVAQVLVNITALGPTGAGYLVAYPADAGSIPSVISVGYNSGTPASTLVAVKLSSSGQIKLTSLFAATDVVIDVEGWFTAPTSGTGVYTASDPGRVADTRSGSRTGVCPGQPAQVCGSLTAGNARAGAGVGFGSGA